MDATPSYIDDFARFIYASPSSYHAVAEAARRLDLAGFSRFAEAEAWAEQPGRHYIVRDGALIAWVQPAGAGPTTPFRILGAHTDSPGFKLKPKPTIGSNGWLQAGVEVYGGPLLNSWLDRELELAGRLVTHDGTEHLVRTGPFLRIPQLAVHLDREVNNGLTLDRQRHLNPVFGVGDVAQADLVGHLAGLAGLAGSDIAGYDLLTADTAPPATFGLGGELFAAGRMDNLTSVHAGLLALILAGDAAFPGENEGPGEHEAHGEVSNETAPVISVLAAFDHEEIGSASRSGAAGPLLDDVLTRIGAGLGATVTDRLRAYAESWCLSADAGHAVHPNYSERHDPANLPVLGGGPLLKINANQRYATDAVGAALFARTCARAGVTYQEFVSNNTVPCGSTIGPLTATRLGIRTVDVGVPLLSMHSARELCHVNDPAALSAAVTAFFTPEE
ncbi:M18 family aminopeptidase [Cryobacterium melibiosiphilum]|uniref:M18 family aminopeptidase n=1 Tax=Cryobacterium melibiosiphilum TaxID=995039 RepID=A0A3A5MGV7_9MICO|nr:M18 family aminopeptidase [Cryobacterium melibiosiphilum]RJT88652.1 M18 family aminopeptidase [Cryobacterium melibiosiphilum]RJT89414.1 M18 family aminopeptidase [Cryobacterium melibiosiphilum]